ncbi:fibrinogen-like protein 1 [Haliotis cracherodii]|uniref:fibrinogen-like protein 1 n=1 Tax=Haliotis cracherodii TaxID=6455 RepID=UPI0039E8D8FA
MRLLLSLLFLGAMAVTTLAQENQCTTNSFRRLPPAMQNEHMCMILERIQFDTTQDRVQRDTQINNLVSMVSRLEGKLSRDLSRISNTVNPKVTRVRGFPALSDIPVARDCNELKMSGVNISGIYPLKLPNNFVVNAFCDMDTTTGGWTVIQRRRDGTVNFTRKWDDYAFGFGNINTEFWLGLDNIYHMTRSMNYTLRVEIWDWNDDHTYALYDYFRVGPEDEFYPLHVSGYEGTAGDSLEYHNKMPFSTPDKDNDQWWTSCANKDRSGWWFKACHYSSLNGVFYKRGQNNVTPDGVINGIIWYHLKNDRSYSLKSVEMKIKPRVAIMEDTAKLAAENARSKKKKRKNKKNREVFNPYEGLDDGSSGAVR